MEVRIYTVVFSKIEEFLFIKRQHIKRIEKAMLKSGRNIHNTFIYKVLITKVFQELL